MKLKNLSDVLYNNYMTLGFLSPDPPLDEYKASEVSRATKAAKLIGISHNTAYTFLTDRVAEKEHLYMNTFALVMIEGLGISKDKFLDMKIGDLFTIE